MFENRVIGSNEALGGIIDLAKVTPNINILFFVYFASLPEVLSNGFYFQLYNEASK